MENKDIEIPPFKIEDVPQFYPSQVWLQLTNKATLSEDLPAKLIKEFAAYLAEPLTDVINTCLIGPSG